MEKQAMNPFLPLDEYIPDGEPHVFEDRIYLFGSHDTEGGTRYCAEGNYVCYSASLNHLSDWRYEGVIFDARQNPDYVEDSNNDLYAPDVVQGTDGRYYLYYNVTGNKLQSGHDRIYVAVCDTPAGKYEHYGYVKNPDGTPYKKYLDGDPAVINDEGIIRLYCGWSLSMVAADAHAAGKKAPHNETPPMPEAGSEAMKEMLKPVYRMMFHKEDAEIEQLDAPLMGANTVELKQDMLTVSGETYRVVSGQFDTPKNSSFYGHAFYEAASIRKMNGTYYFIYSSENSNELCYATSGYPNRDFEYGGTIISNGDVGYLGRKKEDRLNMTANNHGSLECVNGQWYIFYHRQTHNTTFSRQACAEPVEIRPDGTIPQVECTSCGLNGGPLVPVGEYPAAYACNITNGHMPHATNTAVNADIPYITHGNDERYITNIKEGTIIGFKYFGFSEKTILKVKSRGAGSGKYLIRSQEQSGEDKELYDIDIKQGNEWKEYQTEIDFTGTKALYLEYQGSESTELLSIAFETTM